MTHDIDDASAASPSRESFSDRIALLTAELARGELDEASYAEAVATLSDLRSARAQPGGVVDELDVERFEWRHPQESRGRQMMHAARVGLMLSLAFPILALLVESWPLVVSSTLLVLGIAVWFVRSARRATRQRPITLELGRHRMTYRHGRSLEHILYESVSREQIRALDAGLKRLGFELQQPPRVLHEAFEVRFDSVDRREVADLERASLQRLLPER